MHHDRSLGPHADIGVGGGTDTTTTTTEDVGLVSGRFLSDFFKSLEQHGVPATQLLGDLPILVDERGRVTTSVDWVDFVDFMKRLEHHTGGVSGLEACGESICGFRRGSMFQSLVRFSASPYSLYRAASQWAQRPAIPAIETHIEEVETNRIEIRVRLAEGLRPCPQLFHLATGGARALPRILRLSDAVVTAQVDSTQALQPQVERFRASDGNHPLEQSLAILLSSLDAHAESDDESALDAIVSAVERMTQIVDCATTNFQESTTHFRWHETVKFCECICAEFDANTIHSRKSTHSSDAEPANRKLQIDTENAPQVFWAEGRLLSLALESLFDWIAEQASPNAEILLRVEQSQSARDGERMIAFSVAESISDGRDECSDQTRDDEAAKVARLDLVLATAKDAAGAMGGDLHLKRAESGRALVGQLCLPQPNEPPS
jgi:hypothetical protein